MLIYHGGDQFARRLSASAAASQRVFWPRLASGAGSSPRSRCGTQSAGTQPNVGWLTIALAELLDGERPGPAAVVRHEAQQPSRLPMIGIALENRSQAQACQRIRGRIGLGGTLGQLEELLGRSRLDFLQARSPRLVVRVCRDEPGPLREAARTASDRPGRLAGAAARESGSAPARSPLPGPVARRGF